MRTKFNHTIHTETDRFPDDNVKKDVNWAIGVFNNIARRINGRNTYWASSRLKDKENYLRYSGVFDDKEVQYITNPHGDRLPVPYTKFPLARRKIDRIISGFMMNPPAYHCMAVDEESVNKKENDRVKMQVRKLTAEIDKEVEKKTGMNIEYNQTVPLVDDPDEFINSANYKQGYSHVIDTGIQYLKNVKHIDEPIEEALRSYLLTGKAFIETIERDGDPVPKFIAPYLAAYEKGTTGDYLDDCGWFYYEYWSTVGEIKAEFASTGAFDGQEGKEMLQDLEALAKGGNTITQNFTFAGKTVANDWMGNDPDTNATIKVAKLLFQSSKQEAVKVTRNKAGKKMTVNISPKARVKKNKGEKKYVTNVDDPYSIVCLGGMYFIDFKNLPNTLKDVDNMGRRPLPITGIHKDKGIGIVSSLQDLLNPVEDMYSEIMFQQRLMIVRNGGKAFMYDVSQMPDYFGSDVSKLAHTIKQDGIIPVDLSKISQENPSLFNAWKEINLSQHEAFQSLVNMQLALERLADDISGVNDSVMGDIGQYETATNARRNMAMSATRTEIYLKPFRKLLERLYNNLSGYMKYVWADGKGASFWLGETKQALLKVGPEIGLHNYAFYVGNNTKDQEVKDKIEQLMMNLSSNAQGDVEILRALLKVIKTDNPNEAEMIYDKALDVMNQNVQQATQSQMEQARAEMEAKMKEAQDKKDMHKGTLQNNIDVANINAGKSVLVTEMMLEQAEMKERGRMISDAQKASQGDSSGDGTAENMLKEKYNQLKGQQKE